MNIYFYADFPSLPSEICQEICDFLKLDGDIKVLPADHIRHFSLKKTWQYYHKQKAILENCDVFILLAHRPSWAFAAYFANVEQIYGFGFGICGLLGNPPHLSEEMQEFDFPTQCQHWCKLLKN